MEAPLQDWKALFTPCRHFGGNASVPDRIKEVKLTCCSLEELASAKDMSWETFYAFLAPNENGLHRTVSVAPGVFLATSDLYVRSCMGNTCSELAYYMIQTKTGQDIWIWVTAEQATATATATSSCDFLLGLLSGADQPDTQVWAAYDVSPCPVSGDAIAIFLTKSSSNLSSLLFMKCITEEGHFRGFANAPAREGVDIILYECVIDAAAAAFLDCTQKGLGPNYLMNCDIDPIVLAQALASSSRIKALEIGERQWTDRSFRTLCHALTSNKSLQYFDALGMYISDHTWSILCKIFRAHPTLLELRLDLNRQLHGVSNSPMPMERTERRMNDVLAMLHVNSVLEKVKLKKLYSDAPPIPQNPLDKIETRLEMNTSAFEEQCHSLGPVAPDLRPKLLGRALYMARLNPTLLWKFLSEHVDAVVEAAYARPSSNLDTAAQKKRKQADRHDAQKRAKRLSRSSS